jgi:hypothetical protein
MAWFVSHDRLETHPEGKSRSSLFSVVHFRGYFPENDRQIPSLKGLVPRLDDFPRD